MNRFMAYMHIYWTVFPLVVAISLVYAASRHEPWRRIWWHAARLCTVILALLALTTAVLLAINTQV